MRRARRGCGIVGVERHAPVVPFERMDAFRRTLALAFSHRRKTLGNALGAGVGRRTALAALAQAGIDPGRRAETLDLGEFVDLDRALGTFSCDPSWSSSPGELTWQ